MKKHTAIIIGIGAVAYGLIKKPRIGLSSQALDELFRDVERYVKTHPEDNSTKEEIIRRFCHERFGIDNPWQKKSIHFWK